MASAPTNDLPILYRRLEPLSSMVHGNHKLTPVEGIPFASEQHAVPLTAEEFVDAQRFYPIIFSVGETAVPLALMGLNEGVNVFLDSEGKLREEVYVPAYLRRYPFMLAKLRPESEELSLCFDNSWHGIGETEEGRPLFEDGQPSQTTRDILGFCEEFEGAGQRTGNFVRDLEDLKLLIDGEVTIQPDGGGQPFIYRGFRMVSEEALRELRGDVARRLIQSGAMAMIYAHLFSLGRVRDVFARQQAQGKGPQAQLQPVIA